MKKYVSFLMNAIITKLLSFFGMCKSGNPIKKQSFLNKLIDDDNNFSTINFFLVAMTFVGILMLIVPIAGVIVDICFNHTITVNMSDLGSYVLAVSGIFGVAGLSNAWVEYSWNRYGKNIFDKDQSSNDGYCS